MPTQRTSKLIGVTSVMSSFEELLEYATACAGVPVASVKNILPKKNKLFPVPADIAVFWASAATPP